MTLTTIAQSSSPLQLQSSAVTVYEYALTVANSEDNDTQELTAAFTFKPTPHNWQQWLSGWSDTGYKLLSQPQLIRTI